MFKYLSFLLIFVFSVNVNADEISKNLSVSDIRKKADNGDAKAQYKLGEIYFNGEHKVNIDHKKSFEWYLRAAKQNNLDAVNNVASMYYYGIGVNKNSEKSFEWFKKSEQLGDKKSKIIISDMYANGLGVKKDNGKAFEWLKKSAAEKYPEAYFKIGNAYYYGRLGFEKNDNKAFVNYKKSADLGYLNSQSMIAFMYLSGIGVKKDLKNAYKWAKIAEKGYDPRAFTMLDFLHKKMTEEEIREAEKEK